MPEEITIRDVARLVGFSTGTVSRVLNGCHKNFTVKPELRKRILERVAERNYRPNPMYQAMRKKENQQIAIFLPNYLETTLETDISIGVDALNNSLFEKGYSVHYLVRPLEQRATYGLPQWKVAGAVALDVRKSELIRELDESGLSYVVLNGVAGPRGSAVQADDTGNMMCALNHLYELGHRKIGYVNPYRDPDLIPISFSEQHYSVIRRTAASPPAPAGGRGKGRIQKTKKPNLSEDSASSYIWYLYENRRSRVRFLLLAAGLTRFYSRAKPASTSSLRLCSCGSRSSWRACLTWSIPSDTKPVLVPCPLSHAILS